MRTAVASLCKHCIKPACGLCRTLTLHRKLAVAFRDPFLYKVFELALMANRELQQKQSTDSRLREQV